MSEREDVVIRVSGLGKRYKLYARSSDKLADALGVAPLLFWRRNAIQEFWALRNLDLQVHRGERLGIIGRNGAGKSTFLKIVSGVLHPTEGEVRVNGSVQALMELGTAFHPDFTGRQNIRASLAYHGFSAARVADLEDEIVDFAELDDFIEQPIRTYSAGMYARLAFSTATVVQPDILIIDEILGAGDAYFAGKCLERMKRLTEDSGATVLFVSHDLESVQRLCNRVVWIERGRARDEGSPLDIVKRYAETVRREQELRLRAREARLRKKQAAALDALSDLYDRWLFHLVTDHPHPRRRHQVLQILLRRGNVEVGRIDVGAPLDNSAEHLHYIMDAPGFMDWGPAQRRGGRCYEDMKGRYAHAPFEFAVPKALVAEGGEWTLEVTAEPDAGEPVHVERYDGHAYRRLGTLARGATRLSFVAGGTSADGAAREAPALPPAELPDMQYGDRVVEIRRVSMAGDDGADRRTFTVGERVRVRLDYLARARVERPVFVFCAYLPDGQCGTQVCVRGEEIGLDEVEGEGAIEFTFEELLLGQSAYVASAAVFKVLRPDGLESPAYHVWDRCIHFQVQLPPTVKTPRGLCVQPYSASAIATGTKVRKRARDTAR
jgi:lipopolysaccharide transport system ATP-binding protein